MSGTYEDAVAWATTELSPFLSKRPVDFGDDEPVHFMLIKVLRIKYAKDGVPRYDPRILPFLIGLAKSDRGAFDLACEIAGGHIWRGTKMPSDLRDFAISVLDGSFEKPRKSKLSRTFYRNVTFASIVEGCSERFGLKRTRNEASDPVSACDAVSQAAASFGFYLTERALKDLLTHKSSEEFRSFLGFFVEGEVEVEWDLSEVPDVPPPPF